MQIIKEISKKIKYYRRLASHPRTPALAKWLLVLALVYLCSPLDLIPDCIPVLGQLDDMIIVPLIIFLALTLVPAEVRRECAAAAAADDSTQDR